MIISKELQESCDECNNIISFGNKRGWNAEERFSVWEQRYNNYWDSLIYNPETKVWEEPKVLK
jgi:hypothetical protein